MIVFVNDRGALDVDGLPLNATDLAAFVFDLLESRGQQPVQTPETMDAARHAAALMLVVFGVSLDA